MFHVLHRLRHLPQIVWAMIGGEEPLQLTADPQRYQRGHLLLGYRITRVLPVTHCAFGHTARDWEVWGRRADDGLARDVQTPWIGTIQGVSCV